MREDLLELVQLKDVQPDKHYYMQMKYNPSWFYPVVFNHMVNWSSIEEFTRAKRIWQRKEDQQG